MPASQQPLMDAFMFLVLPTYLKPLSEVDALLPEHNAFLDERYRAGECLLSGRKQPRTGGVMLVDLSSREDLQRFVEEDPFYRRGVAQYEVVEFFPSRARVDCQHLLPAAA